VARASTNLKPLKKRVADGGGGDDEVGGRRGRQTGSRAECLEREKKQEERGNSAEREGEGAN
jgi:hypothetical protein